MAKNFPNSMNAMNPQNQLDQRTPNTRNMNKTTSRHSLIKSFRLNYKILKAEEKRNVNYRRTKIKMTQIS